MASLLACATENMATPCTRVRRGSLGVRDRTCESANLVTAIKLPKQFILHERALVANPSWKRLATFRHTFKLPDEVGRNTFRQPLCL